MPNHLIARYAWLAGVLSRYNRLTRGEINSLWEKSHLYDGRPLTKRTFFNYRRGVEENFNVDIKCNGRNEYYIERADPEADGGFTSWLFDSVQINTALNSAKEELKGHVMIEDVPSAGVYLPLVTEAIVNRESIIFSYAGFSRIRKEEGIRFEPYFVRLYRQRWYMVGRRVLKDDIRTYALDRVSDLRLTREPFRMPDINPHHFFRDLVGITWSKAPTRTVSIMTDPRQAKYLRALPLHHSQKEKLFSSYSIFTYKLKLNYELIHELVSLGSSVKVLEPPELVYMVKEELRKTLSRYDREIFSFD